MRVLLGKASNENISDLFQAVLDGQFTEEDSAIVFQDFDLLDDRIAHLFNVFQEGTTHAVAIKSNPIPGVLEYLVNKGAGLEAASFEEVLLAEKAGATSQTIVFDSPVKTDREIKLCHEQFPGMLLNANSLEELDRFPEEPSFRCGLRINPETGAATNKLYNVGDKGSKFGVPISLRSKIVEKLTASDKVTALHVHSGSNVPDHTSLMPGIEKVIALMDEVNSLRAKSDLESISTLDIGGGMGVDYGSQQQNGLEAYANELVKLIGDRDVHLVTEFGRWVHASCSFAISRIEYVTRYVENSQMLFVHLGADMFVREIYSTNKLQFGLGVLNEDGMLRTDENISTDIAGPLCFAGDFLRKNVMLPSAKPGDYLVIRDTGANTIALWSRHCSRAIPKIVGIKKGKPFILSDRQQVD